MDLDQYLEEQKLAHAKAITARDELIAQSGVNMRQLPKVDLERIDPDVRQLLQMQYGVDISAIAYKPPKTASLWRQRTTAVMV